MRCPGGRLSNLWPVCAFGIARRYQAWLGKGVLLDHNVDKGARRAMGSCPL